jgi:HlyD family secretion protein
MEEKLFIEGSEERRAVNFLKTTSSQFGIVRLEPVIKEGQKIEVGDLVAHLASNQYLNDLNTIEARIAAAQANYELLKKGPRAEEIQQAKDKIEQLKTLLGTKEQERGRYQKLWEQKLVSQEEWNKVDSDYRVLESELSIAQNELKILLETPRPEELRKADAEIKQLEAQAAYYRDQVQSSEIRSPITGLVTKIRPYGDIVSIVKYDSVLVMIPVSEKDMDIVKKEQRIRFKVRSYPGKTFEGIVTKVPQQSEVNKDHVVFPLTAKAANIDLILKPGMTGQAKIYCGKKPILSIIARKIVRWFKVEVWSWF